MRAASISTLKLQDRCEVLGAPGVAEGAGQSFEGVRG